MDDWERFNETMLPSKESFYSELNLEDIMTYMSNLIRYYLLTYLKSFEKHTLKYIN